ncbi:MAG: hypothetical protein JWR00_1236 [Rubritepida sp.]|nr:hypothetical protein [Rubritepida sp.]
MPFTPVAKGVRLAVRLTPRASREGMDGVVQGPDERRMLQLRLAAPPVDGAANTALIAFVAKALRLRKSEVAIVSGEKARLKLLELSGDPQGLSARVTAWIADST